MASVDWQCKYLMYYIFPVLKPLPCWKQSRCLGWVCKLPGGQKLSFKLSPLSVGFPQRKPLNLIDKLQFMNSPRGAIYKPPCVQLKKQPFFCYTSSFCTVKFGWRTYYPDLTPVGKYSEINSKNIILCNCNAIFHKNNSQPVVQCNYLNHKQIRVM